MIRVSALKWAPGFARGQVRDLRVRWMLEELGLPYEVRLLDQPALNAPAYRAAQPFGQVPALEIDGETIFESGAIVLMLAQRHGVLLGETSREQARIVSWFFAALNTVEPPIMNLAEVDFFMTDERRKAERRPGVVESIETRLGEVEMALGDEDYLVAQFSIADMMMSTVMRILDRTDMLKAFPKIAALKARCESRPAFRRAHAGQIGEIDAHSAEDMKFGL